MLPKTESDSLEGDAATHGLRENVRYITGMDAAGNSVILASPSLRFHDRGGYAITAIYNLEKIPANIENNSDITYYMASQEPTPANQYSPTSFQLVIPGGANFVQGDFGPSACSAWHRTLSVDFVTVVQGELVLEVGDDCANASQVSLQTGVS
ncbi:uncharacterized protein N7498_004469 [Penicillium cinerascens]|uniref:Uncharacterized protein n=1 Tax=Penicillium cinerascens TaxID=70096 RepID=A0A9W9T7V4_9EURO|nr:uncharacterized protein N7498_004469 [Penicillium cinerascens]KAJ5212823.1 hypothetical protein N7498_004469 [Penicillium cinerascens]